MRTTKSQSLLPIGRTARIAFEIDAMRADCSRAARNLMDAKVPNEVELEECAKLDDALADAHRILKLAVRNVMLQRLNRRSKGSRAK